MALGDPFITNDDLAAYLGITSSKDVPLLDNAIASATQWVIDHCQRDFNKETSATARVYEPDSLYRADVDDFHTVTGLVIKTDTADSGSYDTTWASTDYVLRPHNGIEDGMTGFPYRQIIAVESYTFPCRTGRPRLQVTAQWGWNAVPDAVKQATRILAAEVYRLKDAPLGIATANEFGPLRVREVPQVAMLLRKFQRPNRTGPLVA